MLASTDTLSSPRDHECAVVRHFRSSRVKPEQVAQHAELLAGWRRRTLGIDRASRLLMLRASLLWATSLQPKAVPQFNLNVSGFKQPHELSQSARTKATKWLRRQATEICRAKLPRDAEHSIRSALLALARDIESAEQARGVM